MRSKDRVYKTTERKNVYLSEQNVQDLKTYCETTGVSMASIINFLVEGMLKECTIFEHPGEYVLVRLLTSTTVILMNCETGIPYLINKRFLPADAVINDCIDVNDSGLSLTGRKYEKNDYLENEVYKKQWGEFKNDFSLFP